MSHYIKYLDWLFTPDKIRTGNLYLATSLLSSSLEVNSLTAEVECGDPSILDFERNTPLSYYANPDRPMIFRVQSITRIGPSLYELHATSTLGLLTEGQHMGGIYTGQTAQEVIADICGGVPFIIKSNLREVKLYGWLPIASPRDNLSQVLFAIGAALKTDLDGVLRIEGLWDGISSTAGSDRMYTDASVDYDGKITQVIVTEHQYVPWTEEEQLFEGTAQQGDIITFDEPMHDLAADGFTILDSGANWAKVSAGSGVLTGKNYIHNTRQITKDVFQARDPNVKTVKDATLVSLVNSQACAQRLADYYKCRERVDAPVVYKGELPGDLVATYHPFDKNGVSACLESADITLSNTIKAQERSLVGFVPTKIEQLVTYDNRELLTESGTWTVPEGVTSIRVVLIGGGRHGENGTSGYSNIDTSKTYSSGSFSTPSRNGAQGGAGGAGGAGGNVFDAVIDVNPGQVFSYSIGAAEAESTFGDLTSANGSSSQAGWTDIITGDVYAKPGVRGIDGGKGGNAGYRGESVGAYNGGSAQGSTRGNATYANKIIATYNWGGSGGGGASALEAGKYGVYFSADFSGDSTSGAIRVASSSGGRGGDGGTRAASTIPGCGGNGGHGGGGAGGYASLSSSANGNYAGRLSGFFGGSWCEGGSGGTGGAGAPGCIIIYYGIKKETKSGQFLDKNGKTFLERFSRRFIV